MFNSISWQEYFSVIALLVAGYYGITILFFYRNEIGNIFNQKSSKNINHDSSEDQSESIESNPLMGGIKYESFAQSQVSREEISIAEEISFAPLTKADEAIQGTLDNAINRLASTLRTEIESLLEVIAKDDKRETSTFFQALLHNYPQLVGTDFQEESSKYICDALNNSFAFQIELNEVKSWWPARQPMSDNNQ